MLNNTNLVPAYESTISLDPLSTYTSDDFFGFLDDTEDINGNSINFLDIGIGRIPARETRAKQIVDKMVAYLTTRVLDPGEMNSHLSRMMKIRIFICRMRK